MICSVSISTFCPPIRPLWLLGAVVNGLTRYRSGLPLYTRRLSGTVGLYPRSCNDHHLSGTIRDRATTNNQREWCVEFGNGVEQTSIIQLRCMLQISECRKLYGSNNHIFEVHSLAQMLIRLTFLIHRLLWRNFAHDYLKSKNSIVQTWTGKYSKNSQIRMGLFAEFKSTHNPFQRVSFVSEKICALRHYSTSWFRDRLLGTNNGCWKKANGDVQHKSQNTSTQTMKHDALINCFVSVH